MFCHKCGTGITDDEIFCHTCGTRSAAHKNVQEAEPVPEGQSNAVQPSFNQNADTLTSAPNLTNQTPPQQAPKGSAPIVAPVLPLQPTPLQQTPEGYAPTVTPVLPHQPTPPQQAPGGYAPVAAPPAYEYQPYRFAPKMPPKKKKTWVFVLIPVCVIAIALVVIAITSLSNNQPNAPTVYDPPAPSITPPSEAPLSVTLDQSYRNDEFGFRFSYPDDWAFDYEDDNPDLIVWLDSFSDYAYYASFSVFCYYAEDAEEIFDVTHRVFEAYLLDGIEYGADSAEITDISDVYLDGVLARKAVSSYRQDGFSLIGTYYYYIDGYDVYQIFFRYRKEYSHKYEPIFDAIMDSYRIIR